MAVDQLTENDWARLRDIRLRSIHAEPDLYGWSLQRESSFRESHWRLRLRGAAWWVANDGHVDVGVVSLMIEPVAPPEERHLVSLWVDPTARRRGVGRALVDAAVAQAVTDGAPRVTCWAHEADAAAAHLLDACGFRRTGERVATPRNPGRSEERWSRGLLVAVPQPRRPK